MNLFARNLLPQHGVMCSLCGTAPEDVQHLIFDCKHVVEVWRLVGIWLQHQLSFGARVHSSLIDLCAIGVDKSSRRHLLIIWCAFMWSVWLIQNDVIFKDVSFDILQVLDRIKS